MRGLKGTLVLPITYLPVYNVLVKLKCTVYPSAVRNKSMANIIRRVKFFLMGTNNTLVSRVTLLFTVNININVSSSRSNATNLTTLTS